MVGGSRIYCPTNINAPDYKINDKDTVEEMHKELEKVTHNIVIDGETMLETKRNVGNSVGVVKIPEGDQFSKAELKVWRLTGVTLKAIKSKV